MRRLVDRLPLFTGRDLARAEQRGFAEGYRQGGFDAAKALGVEDAQKLRPLRMVGRRAVRDDRP